MKPRSVTTAAPTGDDRGFTLVELAIVLVIIAFLIGGLLASVTTSREITDSETVQKKLALIHDALLGFAAATGRLPCPATLASAGVESPAATGVCTNPLDGYVPAATLGIGPVDATTRLALDPWGHPIRYAVFPNNIGGTPNVFTSPPPSSMKDKGLTVLSAAGSLLHICGINGTVDATGCGSATEFTRQAVAVVYSQGKNGSNSMSALETANTNGDIVFVSGTPTTAFDDVMVWVSPNVLYNRMITAGRLP